MTSVEMHLVYRGEIPDGDNGALLASRVLSLAATQAARGLPGGELRPSLWDTTSEPCGAWAIEVAGS